MSIFGAVHHGNASKIGWSSIAPALAGAVGRRSCQAGFVEELRALNADVFSAIEQEVELGSVSDDLLRSLAPAANGDFILTVQIYGQVQAASVDPKRILVAHGGGGEARSDAPARIAGPRIPNLEMHAALFSKRHRRTVGLLSMTYAGASLDEAIHQFGEKLGSMMPNFVCRGWSWDAVQATRDLDDAGLPLRRARIIATEAP